MEGIPVIPKCTELRHSADWEMSALPRLGFILQRFDRAWTTLEHSLRVRSSFGTGLVTGFPVYAPCRAYADLGKLQPRRLPVLSNDAAIRRSSLATLVLPLSETVIFTTRARASRVSSVFNCFNSHLRIITP
jgi:hypothetical protein